VWEMKVVKETRKGSRTYTNCMVWRVGARTCNVLPGGARQAKGQGEEGGGAGDAVYGCRAIICYNR